MPTQNQYHIDALLSEMSVAFTNPELIGTKLMPVLEVTTKSGIYYKFDKSKFKIEDSRRSGVARANRVDFGLVQQNYGPLSEHSLEEPVEWKLRDTYPTPMDAYSDATDTVTAKLELSLEKEIATLLRSTANLTQNVTLSGTSRFNDYANSDPLGVFETGMSAIQDGAMVTANTVAMGDQVWRKLKMHPDLLGLLSVASVRVLTPEMFAALVGVENVYIGKAMENTAAEGQTDSLSYVWGKDIILAYVAPRVARKIITLGLTLKLKGARFVDRWTEEGYKADFVRANDEWDVLLVAAEAGYLIKTAVD